MNVSLLRQRFLAGLCLALLPIPVFGSEGKLPAYIDYLNALGNRSSGEEVIAVEVTRPLKPEPDILILDGYPAIIVAEGQQRTWAVDIPATGMYEIELNYRALPGRQAPVECTLLINGELPFLEARGITFPRYWIRRDDEVVRDNRGNDYRPAQTESTEWRSYRLRNTEGLVDGSMRVFLEQGVHQLTLAGRRESMAVSSMLLVPVSDPGNYESYRKKAAERGFRDAPSGYSVKLQAEEYAVKTDAVTTAFNDRTSPATEPYHVSKIRMNVIGGDSWKRVGQIIEWDFDVPEDGLYKIVLRSRQDIVRGSPVTRRLLLDGKVPFAECEALSFPFRRGWRMDVPGDEDPYLFALTAGRHRFALEVNYGPLGPILSRMESAVLDLNTMYRTVIMITGTVPDPYRDYRLDKRIPGMIESLEELAFRLRTIKADLALYQSSDGGGEVLERLAYQLDDMATRPETIPRRIDSFKTNIGAVGSWMLEIRDQPLTLDTITIASADWEISGARASLGQRIIHAFGAFFASFFEDYDTVGNVVEGERVVEVWVLAARERAQILKPLIDENFSRESGIGVNVKLIDEKVLLPATLAGRGPDVVLNAKRATPVNYALRNSVADLSSFPEFEQVAQSFSDSAMVPFRLNGGVYGLPEQELFDVLFYREDILEGLGLGIPDTWDDLMDVIPHLQKNNLDFGLPFAVVQGADPNVLPPNPTFSMLLFQNGGEFYEENGRRSGLDSEQSIYAFAEWCNLFTHYKLDLEYDFANRFRTGEMPMAIQRYDNYNLITVFAPELRGLWNFAPVPGTRMPDGSVRRNVVSDSTAAMLMSDCRDVDAAWDFLRWWVSTGTQSQFGRELENFLGPAGRYPTANREALQALPWPVDVLDSLQSQWPSVRGIEEQPGGYFTGRHLDNAFRKVVLDGGDPRDTLLDYVDVINDEISQKRKEFGLE